MLLIYHYVFPKKIGLTFLVSNQNLLLFIHTLLHETLSKNLKQLINYRGEVGRVRKTTFKLINACYEARSIIGEYGFSLAKHITPLYRLLLFTLLPKAITFFPFLQE